jgi:Transposase DDE domain
MSQRLYKDTFNFLKKTSQIKPEGNHLKRLTKLSAMICSCMTTKKSSLESLSNSYDTKEVQKESHIKQSKRFLTSKWTDWLSFFAPFIVPILEQLALKGELILIIDGTQTAGNCNTLMLSVIWKKYAIPLVWLTKVGEKGHFGEHFHLDLVNQIAPIIPKNCRVVILGDGEFDGKLLREQIQILGWEYVLRTSKDRKIAVGCGETVRFDQVGLTSDQDITFINAACEQSHAIYWLGKGFEEPIYLLTNMDLAEMACDYYRKRFKIELLFKQLKSAGFNLQKSMIESAVRCANLIMILAFAFIFTFCLGLLIKKQTKEVINKIYRFDRIEIVRPITLAQKCLQNHKSIAEKLFYQFNKQWLTFFT